MPRKIITITDANGKAEKFMVSNQDEFRNAFPNLVLIDKDDIRICAYESLQDGETYRLVNKRMRPTLTEEIPFTGTEKKALEMDELAKLFGGLLDRESSKEQLFDGLMKLAERTGTNVDKKEVPVLGISAPSGAGKTEFLRWIFNHCCTFLPEKDKMGDTATKLLEKINGALPHGQEKFDNMLVLFASFSQLSSYVKNEGPILSTTTERLLRSFHGDISMIGNSIWSKKRFQGFSNFEDITRHFSSDSGRKGKTGFIFCIDEVSKLRKLAPDEYNVLMDSLLSFSQDSIARGGFCAIVAAALSIFDFGEVVLDLSGRSLIPIQFPTSKPEMVKSATDFIRKNSDVLAGAESGKEAEEFFIRVALSVLESNTRITMWENIMRMKPTETRVRAPLENRPKPVIFTYDEIFLLVAQGLFEKNLWTGLEKNKLDALFNQLQGRVVLKPIPYGLAKYMNDLQGRMELPAWRLLEFEANGSRMFSLVQNWVLVETRKLFYEYSPAESQKTWELATMGVLELRRAMLFACKNRSLAFDDEYVLRPTLADIFEGLDLHHNIEDEDIWESVSHEEAASNIYTENLQENISKKREKPSFCYSALENELGVEGVFTGGFHSCEDEDIPIFFQMKMYTKANPGQIMNWLKQSDARAQALGLKVGSYVIQLFVTGAIERSIKTHVEAWPKNCMVFGTRALETLFEPFGNGIIAELIKMKSREM